MEWLTGIRKGRIPGLGCPVYKKLGFEDKVQQYRDMRLTFTHVSETHRAADDPVLP